MKSFIVVGLLAVATLVLAKPNEAQYTAKYDNMDIQEILGNRPLLIRYIRCLLHEVKCTPEGLELRKNIKDALQNNCEKCTDAQKKGIHLVIEHLINHEEEYWKKLVAFYDPEGKFTAKYEKEFRSVKA